MHNLIIILHIMLYVKFTPKSFEEHYKINLGSRVTELQHFILTGQGYYLGLFTYDATCVRFLQEYTTFSKFNTLTFLKSPNNIGRIYIEQGQRGGGGEQARR